MNESSPSSAPIQASRLKGALGYPTYFALGFGCIVGSGWVLVLKEWIGQAGIGGAILGFVCGGIVMAAIAACYAELTNRLPEAGGEFVYMRATFGDSTAFIVGWFLLLNLVSVMIFEGIALALALQQILPWIKAATSLYSVLGHAVTIDAILISIVGALAMGAINIRGNRSASSFHNILTYGFLIITLILLCYVMAFAVQRPAPPLLDTTNGGPWWHGALWIFATCGLLLNGFQVIPQAIEERDATLKLSGIARIMILAVIGAAAFYCFAIIACGLSLPATLLANAEMPPILAVSLLPFGAALSTAFLIALIMSILKTWNGILITAVRLMVAMARVGHFPSAFAATRQSDSTPVVAIVVLTGLTLLGAFLGAGAIVPIINMCSIGATAVLAACCIAVVILRRRGAQAEPEGFLAKPWAITIGFAGAVIMAATALIMPLLSAHAQIPLEYILLSGWAAIGTAFWLGMRTRLRASTRIAT